MNDIKEKYAPEIRQARKYAFKKSVVITLLLAISIYIFFPALGFIITPIALVVVFFTAYAFIQNHYLRYRSGLSKKVYDKICAENEDDFDIKHYKENSFFDPSDPESSSYYEAHCRDFFTSNHHHYD